jgi:hypothetical protein
MVSFDRKQGLRNGETYFWPQLDTVQRLNILCKLMPYVLPKTEIVKANFGELNEFEIKRWHD